MMKNNKSIKISKTLVTLVLIPYICLTAYMASLGAGFVVYQHLGYDMDSQEQRVCSRSPENYYVICPIAGFGMITTAGMVIIYGICMSYIVDQKCRGVWDVSRWMNEKRNPGYTQVPLGTV